MSKTELVKLYDEGDIQRLMVAVCREWMERYYPQAEYSVLVVGLGANVPAARVTITPQVAA